MGGKEINPDVENQAVIDRYCSAPCCAIRRAIWRSDENDKALEIHGESQNAKVVKRGTSVARIGTSAQTKDDQIDWITEIKKIWDVQQGSYLQMWNSIFLISCAFAVSLDPLFFYVVNVDQDEKCLHTDEKLKIVALVMRSLTDVIFVMHLICEISDSVQKTMDENEQQTRGNSGKKWEAKELIQYAKKTAQNMSWLSIIVDVLSIFPLPQLIILMFYPKEGSGFVENTMFVNVFLLGQYVPRIFRIHLSAKVFKRMNGIWAKGLFNLFLYILAGHVLGAFWYFFSIQREALCWHEACVKFGCEDTLYCDSRIAGYISILNKSCPLDTPDSALSPFDFGIFLDSLKNENPNQKFGKKFLYSFWWGLRNLSNFGTNLETSTYVWENLFAIFISIIGLLLFLYLIGNVQAFMQMEATKTEDMRRQGMKTEETKTEEANEEMRQKAAEDMRRQGIITEETKTEEANKEMRQKAAKIDAELRQKAAKVDEEMRRKMKMKMLDVRRWMSRNELPHDIKEEILSSIYGTLTEHIDADLHNFLFSNLPVTARTSLKRCLCMKTLTKIPMLKDMGEKVLTMMCDYLKPATYIENGFFFRTGDPLDCMLFIIEGTMWTYASSDSHVGQGISSMAIKPLRKGDFYGEELLDWASDSFTELPISSKYVKSQTKVEAFVLMAKDLETVVSRCKTYWDLQNCNNPEEVALSTVRRIRRRAQQRPRPSPAEIWSDIGEILPSTASK